MNNESEKKVAFVGPGPFEQQDKDIFFGRDRETNDILSLIIAHRTLLLYAQSGAGKTSLIKAGLIPRFIEERFEFLPIARVKALIHEEIKSDEIDNIYVFNTIMSWQFEKNECDESDKTKCEVKQLKKMTLKEYLSKRKHLLDEEALPAPRIVIFDQFEELFSFYPERRKEREDFFIQIADALKDDPLLRVLFAIREDYLAHLDPYIDILPERLRNCYRLERLRGEAACQAIQKPFEGIGLSFEEGAAPSLVQELLKTRSETSAGDVVETIGEYVEPVQLQIVCKNLLESLPSGVNTITLGNLQDFGNVDEALMGFYEKAVDKTTKETGLGEGDLRDWFEKCLVTPAGTRGTVFRGHATTGEIDNKAIDVLEKEHIIRAEVLRGARWYELTHDRLVEPIQRSNENWFHQTKIKEQQIQLKKESTRADIHEKTAKRRLHISWILAIAIVLVIGAAYFSWTQLQRATRQAQLLFSNKLVLSSINNLDVDPERSLLLSLQAILSSPSIDTNALPEIEDSLRRAVSTSHSRITLSGHNNIIEDAVFSPDGKHLVYADASGELKICDAESGKEKRTITGHSREIFCIAFNSDGTYLATASRDKTAKIWDVVTGKMLSNFSKHTDTVFGVAFSPDGKRIVTSSADKKAIIWDSLSGQEIYTLEGHTGYIYCAAFSPDGKRIATGSADKTAKVWDADSGQELFALKGHTSWIRDISYNHDGTQIATASGDGTTKVWNVLSGDDISPARDQENPSNAVDFSPDGKRLVTAGWDGKVKLWDSSGNEILVIDAHNNHINSAEFSPDGKKIITCSDDGILKVWNSYSGGLLLNVTSEPAGVFSVAFDPHGIYLATGSSDHKAKIWNAMSGKEMRTLSGHKDTICFISFSPDGKRIATASWDGTAKVWNADSGQEELTLEDHTAAVMAVAFSPKGKRLATASWDGTAKVWDANSGQELLPPLAHTRSVHGVAFSPDGKRIATASLDGTAKVWNADSGEELLTLVHSDYVFSVAFSPDGKRIATASWDGTAKVWNADSGQEMQSLTGHSGGVTRIIFFPNKKCIATASWDRTVKIWNSDDGKEIFYLTGHTKEIYDISYCPILQRLATASLDGTVKIWDISSMNKFGAEWSILKGHRKEIHDVDFSPDNRHIATASADNTAIIWDIESGSPLLKLPHGYTVYSVAFSHNGKHLVTGSTDKTAKVWDVESGEELLTLVHSNYVFGVAFSPNGKQIATACWDGTAKIWDAKSGQELHTLEEHTAEITRVTFSPDGKRIATASRDRTAKVWKVESGQQLLTLLGHTNYINDIAFSLDGERIATASGDGTAKIWDAATGVEKLSLLGHKHFVVGIAFSPDGEHVATCSADKTIKLWDAESGVELLTLLGHSKIVRDVAFSQDGRRLVSVSDDTTVRVYALKIDDLINLAINRLSRTLTPEECEKFLNEDTCALSPITYLVEGKNLAMKGEIIEAIQKFKQSMKLKPILKFDPEKKAKEFALYAPEKAGYIYFEILYKYEDAYKKFKEALEINPNKMSSIANFAEANLAVNRYKEAFEIAKRVLKKSEALHSRDIDYQLAMRFVCISSLVLQGNTEEAINELEDFLNYYRDIVNVYVPTWSYKGVKHYIKEQLVDDRIKKLLLELIDILEVPNKNIEIELFKNYLKNLIITQFLTQTNEVALEAAPVSTGHPGPFK